MLLQTHEASVALEDRQVLSLCNAEGMELRATRGTLWVTQDGDLSDSILEVGDSLLVQRGGRTVVAAVAGAAALAATRRQPPTLTAIWRNLRARVAHGALLGEPERLRPMVHE